MIRDTDISEVFSWLKKRLAEKAGPKLITLDGPCASGKTTLAGELAAAGAKTASHEEIGKTCDVVLTMLPNSPGK